MELSQCFRQKTACEVGVRTKKKQIDVSDYIGLEKHGISCRNLVYSRSKSLYGYTLVLVYESADGSAINIK